MKKLIKERIIYAIVGIIFIIGVILIILFNNKFQEFQQEGNAFLSLDNYTKIDINVQDNNIILSSKCKAIIVTIPEDRALILKNALEKQIEPRPSIYDSTVEIMNYFDLELNYVKIERMENNIYYSKAVFSNLNKILNLDMRPSDAMALALKLDKLTYINTFLLDTLGQNIC